MATPMFIVTGFLDSGKTTMIKDTLMEQEWIEPGLTLLLLCEEGEEEYPEEYLKENSTIFVQKKVNRFFIKEAKTNSDYSPFDADLSELLGELLWYGRVLYTNGLIWTCFKITKLNYSSDDESNLSLIHI